MTMTTKPFPQVCTITKDEYTVDALSGNKGARGYKILDEKKNLIGVVLLDPKYEGRAVIRFLNEVKPQYGVWHLIQQEYPFSYLSNTLAVEASITFTVK